jgi:hypothetical protein
VCQHWQQQHLLIRRTPERHGDGWWLKCIQSDSADNARVSEVHYRQANGTG